MGEHPNGLKERMDERFDDVDRRFGEVDRRIDERFDGFGSEISLRFKQVDERFDRADAEMQLRFKGVDERLDRVDDGMRELRVAIKDLHEDNKATLRVTAQGFIAISGAIVAGCAIVAGVNAF
jgi:hypothetical protein